MYLVKGADSQSITQWIGYLYRFRPSSLLNLGGRGAGATATGRAQSARGSGGATPQPGSHQQVAAGTAARVIPFMCAICVATLVQKLLLHQPAYQLCPYVHSTTLKGRDSAA